MKFLIDTNILLEILLGQGAAARCKGFLNQNMGSLCISDFSLHSIGVILFRNNKAELFSKFTNDVLPRLLILTLDSDKYDQLQAVHESYRLDFDDAYQYLLASSNDLTLVTMDKDFNRVANEVKVIAP